MGKDSKIEWCTHTFNPWWGCEKVSAACANCYAEMWAKRCGAAVWGAKAGRRVFGEKHWNEPLKWDAKAKAAGVRERVFCASMADVFEDRADLVPERVRLLELIGQTPNLDWLLLTKRPQNWERLLREACRWHHERHDASTALDWAWHWGQNFAPPNVWMGTTVENQAMAETRIPQLLYVPAKVRFLSCEPLLGAVDLTAVAPNPFGYFEEGIHWVICGGESEPGARPMHPGWARGLRDQCAGAGVPFLFKQWGEWIVQHVGMPELLEECTLWPDGTVMTPERFMQHAVLHGGRRLEWGVNAMGRVGKKAAGRLLDGVEHNGFPQGF